MGSLWSVPQTLELSTFPPMEKNVIFFQEALTQIRIPPPKWIWPGIASTKKGPKQKGLAGVYLLWAAYNLHLKHRGWMHSLPCKSTLIVFQKPTTKIWIQPFILSMSKDCSHTKEARTERSFWPLHGLGRWSCTAPVEGPVLPFPRKGDVIHIQETISSIQNQGPTWNMSRDCCNNLVFQAKVPREKSLAGLHLS